MNPIHTNHPIHTINTSNQTECASIIYKRAPNTMGGKRSQPKKSEGWNRKRIKLNKIKSECKNCCHTVYELVTFENNSKKWNKKKRKKKKKWTANIHKGCSFVRSFVCVLLYSMVIFIVWWCEREWRTPFICAALPNSNIHFSPNGVQFLDFLPTFYMRKRTYNEYVYIYCTLYNTLPTEM